MRLRWKQGDSERKLGRGLPVFSDVTETGSAHYVSGMRMWRETVSRSLGLSHLAVLRAEDALPWPSLLMTFLSKAKLLLNHGSWHHSL